MTPVKAPAKQFKIYIVDVRVGDRVHSHRTMCQTPERARQDTQAWAEWHGRDQNGKTEEVAIRRVRLATEAELAVN